MRAGYVVNYLNPYGRGKFARIRTCECDLCLGEMEDEREREARELQEADE